MQEGGVSVLRKVGMTAFEYEAMMDKVSINHPFSLDKVNSSLCFNFAVIAVQRRAACVLVGFMQAISGAWLYDCKCF